MIPVGYMAKRISGRPEFLKASTVNDIYSVSGCVSEDFADFVNYWKHNGYWFFDQPEIISDLAKENNIDLSGTKLFFYEVYEQELASDGWRAFGPWEGRPEVNVSSPSKTILEGFDVVTFWPENSSQPCCSPLSCNSMAEEIPTNSHCLLSSLDEAKERLEAGAFAEGEPGPHRILAVYSVDEPWPPVGPELSTGRG